MTKISSKYNKKMKKFKYFYPLPIYVILITFAVLICLNVLLTILSLTEVLPILHLWYNNEFAIYNLIASLIALFVVISFLQAKYVFGERLCLMVGFVNLLQLCFVNRIYNAVKKDEKLYISYKYKDLPEPIIVRICIEKEQIDDFILLLQQRNPYLEISKDD